MDAFSLALDAVVFSGVCCLGEELYFGSDGCFSSLGAVICWWGAMVIYGIINKNGSQKNPWRRFFLYYVTCTVSTLVGGILAGFFVGDPDLFYCTDFGDYIGVYLLGVIPVGLIIIIKRAISWVSG